MRKSSKISNSQKQRDKKRLEKIMSADLKKTQLKDILANLNAMQVVTDKLD